MNTVESFLAAVLPSQGFRFIFLSFPDGKPAQKDFSPDETSEMLGFAQWGIKKGANAYVAIGGYQPGPDGTLKRQAVLATLHRCLRIDLDVGELKPYQSKRAALSGLQNFCLGFGMPAPWVIDSGYGIHAYWVFDRDISLRDWLPLADRLRSACEGQGLHVDPTVTIDAARVLRLPGSFNFKNAGSVPVRILAAGTPSAPDALSALLPVTAAPRGAPGLQIAGNVPAILAGAMPTELQENQFPPYFIRNVLGQCPGMRSMFSVQGAGTPEPLWKLALDLVNNAADDEAVKFKIARHLSTGYPTFTEAEFSAKWAQTQRQNYHPPSCSRMAMMGMPECARCPLRATIKSPVSLGQPQLPPAAAPDMQPAVPEPTAALVITPLPHAVQMGIFLLAPGHSTVQITDGNLTKELGIREGKPCQRILIKEKDDQGKEVVREWWSPIMPYKLLEVERLLDAVGKQQITVLTFDRYTDKVEQVEFTTKALAEPQSFMATLAGHGIHVTRKQAGLLQDTFMPEFLSQLQRARAANQIAGRCGWTDDKTGFVLGTRLFTHGLMQHVRPANAPAEMQAYHEAGDEAAWRKAFDLALSGGPDRQAVLALSLAAPLMVFTGLDGVMLNAYSPESGVGKSTLCDAALSIWGAPEKLRKDFRDTANATFKLASVVGNLPMVVDEFTNVEGRALSDYIYTITQGREKHRLTADSRLNASGVRWCLPTIVTSNNSIHDKLQAFRGDAVAEAARVFELRLRPLHVPMDQMGAAKSDLLALRSNYGFLGPKLVEVFLARNPEHWHKVVAARIAWWDKEVSTDASDRFRAAACALIDIGCALGAALGYAFDRDEVITVIREQWVSQQIEFEASRKQPSDFVNDYIRDHSAEFVTFGGTDGKMIVNDPRRRVYGELRGKTVNSQHVASSIMIPTDALREYVREKNGNYKSVVEWMRSELAKPSGLVSRMGKLLFLAGHPHNLLTQAVEFHPSIMGAAVVPLTLLEGNADLPAGVDRIGKRS